MSTRYLADPFFTQVFTEMRLFTIQRLENIKFINNIRCQVLELYTRRSSLYKYSLDIATSTNTDLQALQAQRKIAWRKQPAIVRVEKPLRLRRARSLGYKAKPGFITVRVRVRRGGLRKSHPVGGRRQRHAGFTRIVPAKSMQLIGEERVGRAYPNLEVLNSYWVGEDGRYKWFEVLLVDPHHPGIQVDTNINWISDNSQQGRVHRGLTSAGKKMRGLRH